MRFSPLFVLLFVTFVIWALSSCEKDTSEKHEKQEKSPKEIEKEILSKMKINEETENVLFTYMNEKKKFVTVENSEDVPDPYRNDVIVVNLALKPEERLSSTKVVIVDLNQRTPEGYFKARLEDRASFENSLRLKRKWRLSETSVQMQQANPDDYQGRGQKLDGKDGVVLYSTAWCGYCRKVREFFAKNGVKFVEKDIEKTMQAQKELQAKCRMARIECNGVPVVDWEGVILPGFQPEMYRKFLENPPKKSKPASPPMPSGALPDDEQAAPATPDTP